MKDSPSKQKKVKYRSGLYAVLHFLLAKPILWVSRMRVIGREYEPKKGEGSYLLICNHMKWYDPIWLCAALKHYQPHFMAKQELFRVPGLNLLLKALGAYPVNRGGADVGAIRRTITMLQEGKVVGMFPQGHRYNGEDPRQTDIKSGAAMIAVRAGVPVLPVFIKAKGHRPRFLQKKEIIIGKPISPEELNYCPDESGEYARIASFLFEKVCELGD
jgi:1-acyl-sn-glycerol-3-phosphate acyltransferase